MRSWHEWTSEEKELFTEFHSDGLIQKQCPMKQLSFLKATIDIEMYQRPLSVESIHRAGIIMDVVRNGKLTREGLG